jgi:hypothetical protein
MKKFRLLLLGIIAFLVLVIAIKHAVITDDSKEILKSPNVSRSNLDNLVKLEVKIPDTYSAEEVKEYNQLIGKIFFNNSDATKFESDSVSFKVRVVDQHGNPIADAFYEITYTAGMDPKVQIHGSLYNKTDENGIFNVTINKKISTVRVAARKVGYIYLKDKSDKKISVASAKRLTEGLSMQEKERWEQLQRSLQLPYNTLDKILDDQGIVTLTLKKMSNYDKMYQNMFSYSVIARDMDERIPGKYMMEYRNHNSDGIVPEDAHVIHVGPCFYDKSKENDLHIRYNKTGQVVVTPAAPWYCEMSIPGGGFFLIDEKIEPDGELYASQYSANAREGEEFLAPESGYVEIVRAEVPETLMNENWRYAITRNYYVKFSDNTFGRINVRFSSGQKYSITSWYNPTGRRNTEFCLEDDLDVKYIEKKR